MPTILDHAYWLIRSVGSQNCVSVTHVGKMALCTLYTASIEWIRHGFDHLDNLSVIEKSMLVI